MPLTITINVENQDVNRVLNSISGNFGRPEEIDNPDFDPGRPENPSNRRRIPNPESKEDFVNRILRQFLAEHVYAYEVDNARQAAQNGVTKGIGASQG